MQVQEENGQLICLKHRQIIQLIVMDDNTPPEDQMLCLMCMSSCKQQYKQVVKVEQAKKIIKEKLILQDEKNQLGQLINKLSNLQSNMVELRQQLSKNIETITRIIDYLRIKLKNNDLVSIVKGLELLKLQNRRTKIKKLDQSEQSQKLNKSQEKSKHLNQNDHKIQQDEDSGAIAFNGFGSIMISGDEDEIKVWEFNKGQMKEVSNLVDTRDCITTLLFSKNKQWFISGDDSGNIKCWKKGQTISEWIGNETSKQHTDTINCVIFTQDEDYLLSCSDDHTIIVWNADYQNNILEYQYSLENKHTLFVNGLSLNFSNTSLVSCGEDKQLILWQKEQNNKWIYKNSIVLEKPLIRIGFVDLNQILVQQDGQGFTNVLEVNNQELIEKKDLKIELNNKNEFADYDRFPTIYNKNKNIIIQKSNQFVYIIRKNNNGQFRVAAPIINCDVDENYGALTEDGEFLVIWNKQTKEFRVYQISL